MNLLTKTRTLTLSMAVWGHFVSVLSVCLCRLPQILFCECLILILSFWLPQCLCYLQKDLSVFTPVVCSIFKKKFFHVFVFNLWSFTCLVSCLLFDYRAVSLVRCSHVMLSCTFCLCISISSAFFCESNFVSFSTPIDLHICLSAYLSFWLFVHVDC